MGKISSCIAAILLCSVWGVSQAKADVCGSVAGNIVQNCGFESGSLANWAIGGNAAGGTPNSYGVDNTMPNSGQDEAYFGAVGSPISLSQTVAALAGEKYQVSFYLDQNSQDNTGGYVHSFDVSFDGALLDSNSNVSYSGGYSKYTFTATTAPSNNSDVLKFDFQNDDDFFFLDDVSVTALGAAAPEPASFLLVVPALAGMFLIARRRRAVA
jgi:hypothetical protein